MGAGLTISRAAVTLEPAAVQVDVREFETLIARPDAASLERAVQLYRDDFLAGFVLRGCPDFEEWQASVAEGLRQSLARGLQRLVAACIADGDLERAAGHARRWLQLDPAARACPSGDHQAARLGRPAFGGHAAVPVPGPRAGPGPGRPAAARDDQAVRRRAGRAAGPAAGAFGAAAGSPAAARALAMPGPGLRGRCGFGGAAGVWPLVGRERELAALRAAWQATGGAGRVVAIAGPGGQREDPADHRVPGRGGADRPEPRARRPVP